MKRAEVVKFISGMVDEDGLTFEHYTDKLIDLVEKLSTDDVMLNLLECGVIPESYPHDSTEEKVYAKYSDILLARALSLLGLQTKVIKERADSADVEAKAKNYTLVADAKVFRLSRTAKNQKDFKVEALNRWRKDKDYACVVAPLYQYPRSSSQIYRQAIDKNVTLLSYSHLYFALQQKNRAKFDYKPLWEAGKRLKGEKDAVSYWTKIDETLCKILGKKVSDLNNNKQIEKEALKKTGAEEVAYIEGRISAIKSLTHEEAITRLIKSEKLDNKIIQIKKILSLK